VLVMLIAAWFFERWRWARWGALAITTLLLFSWAWSAHVRNAADRFVIYDERDRLTCAVVSGRSLTIFTDTLDAWTRTRIDQHQRASGAWQVDTMKGIPTRIIVAERTVLLIDPSWESTDTVAAQPSLVVLKGSGRYEIDRLYEQLRPPEGFVLSPAINGKNRAYLRHWCMEHDVPVHDLRIKGAYVR
jgi:hypothetical protein